MVFSAALHPSITTSQLLLPLFFAPTIIVSAISPQRSSVPYVPHLGAMLQDISWHPRISLVSDNLQDQMYRDLWDIPGCPTLGIRSQVSDLDVQLSLEYI